MKFISSSLSLLSAILILSGCDATGSDSDAGTGLLSVRLDTSSQLVVTEDALSGRNLTDSQGQWGRNATRESDSPKSNAFYVKSNGDIGYAIESDEYDIAIASVLQIPERNSIVFSLEVGTMDRDNSIDFIGQNDCALFEASISTSNVHCIARGISTDYRLENIDHGGARGTHQANQDPFEYHDGTLFLQGIKYSLICDGGGACFAERERTHKQYIWRLELSDAGNLANIGRISQLDEYVMNFHATSKDSVFYRADAEATGHYSPRLKFWNMQYGVQNLTTGGTGNFIGDDSRSVIFDSNEGNPYDNLVGLSTSTPYGTLKTRLPTPPLTDDTPATLEAVMVSDDGRVFTASRVNYSNEGDALEVQQVLPYQAGTLHTIPLNEDVDRYFGGRGMLVSSGYLYYLQQIDAMNGTFSLGTADVIKSVRLLDGQVETFLESDWTAHPDSARYSIGSWVKNGNSLVFAALEQLANEPYLVDFDLSKQRRGDSDFLTSVDVSSTFSASNAIKDIVNYRAIEEVAYTGDIPVVSNILVSADNPHSASFQFSTFMNQQDVNDAVYIKDQSDNEIPTLKIWLGRYLHLIPDTSTNGLADSEYAWLEPGDTYTVGIDKSAYIESLNGSPLQFADDRPNDLVITINP